MPHSALNDDHDANGSIQHFPDHKSPTSGRVPEKWFAPVRFIAPTSRLEFKYAISVLFMVALAIGIAVLVKSYRSLRKGWLVHKPQVRIVRPANIGRIVGGRPYRRGCNLCRRAARSGLRCGRRHRSRERAKRHARTCHVGSDRSRGRRGVGRATLPVTEFAGRTGLKMGPHAARPLRPRWRLEAERPGSAASACPSFVHLFLRA